MAGSDMLASAHVQRVHVAHQKPRQSSIHMVHIRGYNIRLYIIAPGAYLGMLAYIQGLPMGSLLFVEGPLSDMLYAYSVSCTGCACDSMESNMVAWHACPYNTPPPQQAAAGALFVLSARLYNP